MEIRFVALELPRIDGLRFEAAALSFFEDERPLRGAAGLCDWRLCGRLSDIVRGTHVAGTRGEVTLVPTRPRLPFDKLVLFGLGPSTSFDQKVYEHTVTQTLEALGRLRLRSFVWSLPGRATGRVSPEDAMRWFLALASDRADLDEVVILDDAEAQRAMSPIVDADKRRQRAAREMT